MSSSSHCNDLNQASASSSGGTDDTGSSEEIYADIISRIRLCQTYMNDALANNRPGTSFLYPNLNLTLGLSDKGTTLIAPPPPSPLLCPRLMLPC